MLDKITLNYPIGFVLFCLLAGFIYAFFMYYKEQKFNESAKWLKPMMAVLRFLSVSFISFLLLSPILKKIKEDIKQPIIIIAEDRSQSIETTTNKDELISYKEQLNAISKELVKDYEVVRLNFGEKATASPNDSFNFQSTNISNALNYIYENYIDQNIGAIVLSSDGIYNEGKNPLYQNISLKSPLYTIALGDTTIRKDLSVSNIYYNKIAYLGDKVGISADISAINSLGSVCKARLYKIENNKKTLLDEKSISIKTSNDYQSVDYIINADQAGIVRYSIVLSQLKDESSYQNNSREFYIEVLDGKQKILILANGPHPDIAAYKNLIERNKNYEVNSQFIGYGKTNVSDYDLVIFHNLPSSENDINTEISILNKKKTPRLFIVGSDILQTKFNNYQNTIKLIGNSNTNEYVQGEVKSGFTLFTFSNRLKERLKKYPPLVTQFGEFKPDPLSDIALTQRIKKINTTYPLLSFTNQSSIKTGVLSGEGIWRWRLFDYQEEKNYDSTEEFVNKIIQYLTVKEDKRKFRVNLAKNAYKENEDIVFDAQLYNNSYELINDPDIPLSIKDQNGREYTFTFSKTNNYYTLNAGQFPDGSYEFSANTNYSGENISSKGKFSVQKIQLEQYNLVADHGLLVALSKKYNGKTYFTKELNVLKNELTNNENIKPTVYLSSSTESILHNKWIFWLLASLLFLEWFMRRYFGSY